jgi:tetratricopeptide (TPR) repeat protein
VYRFARDSARGGRRGAVELLGVLLLCAFPALPAVQDPAGVANPATWRETWGDLARLAESAPGSTAFQRIWRELDALEARRERSARKSHDRAEVFRARVLRAHLSRLSGTPFRPVGEPGGEMAFLPGEGWIAAQVAGPGPTRVRAMDEALSQASAENLRVRLERGQEVSEEDARGLHLDWALDEARLIHEYAPDGRTASLLARVLGLRGEHGEAAKVLEHQVAATRESAERAGLLAELGKARIAAGADAAALRELGAALALGSQDAGYSLATRALSRGEIARARALFRALLEEEPSAAPAQRGYGLALLGGAGPPSRADG